MIDLRKFKLVDLTQPWCSLTPTWPYFPSSKVTAFHSHHRDGISSNIVETNMHSGTHVDAPLHMSSRGWDCAQIPLERLLTSTVILDMRRYVDEWALISADMVKSRLREVGETLHEGDGLILYYGWHRYNWVGEEKDEEKFFCRHPGPDESLTDFLVETNVSWVGCDAPAFEHPFNTAIRHYRKDLVREFERKVGKPLEEVLPERSMLHCHKRMMARNQMHIDNIGGDVGQLVDRRVWTIAFPWRWIGGDASITRLVALVEP